MIDPVARKHGLLLRHLLISTMLVAPQVDLPFMRPVKNPVKPETDPPTYLKSQYRQKSGLIRLTPSTSTNSSDLPPKSHAEKQEFHLSISDRSYGLWDVPYPSKQSIAKFPVRPLAPQKIPVMYASFLAN
jgi:hypothetical protein